MSTNSVATHREAIPRNERPVGISENFLMAFGDVPDERKEAGKK